MKPISTALQMGWDGVGNRGLCIRLILGMLRHLLRLRLLSSLAAHILAGYIISSLIELVDVGLQTDLLSFCVVICKHIPEPTVSTQLLCPLLRRCADAWSFYTPCNVSIPSRHCLCRDEGAGTWRWGRSRCVCSTCTRTCNSKS